MNKRFKNKNVNFDNIYRILKDFNDKVKISDVKKAIHIWKDVIKLDVYKIGEYHFKMTFCNPVIYYLIKEREVVYVGETTSLMSRISDHYREGKKDFDSFRFVPFEGTDFERKQKEREEIMFHKPKYNIVHNKDFCNYIEENNLKTE